MTHLIYSASWIGLRNLHFLIVWTRKITHYEQGIKRSPESKSSVAPNTVVKKMLPEYIVNCYLSSGYDEICNLNITSNNLNNGMVKVESYINRKFANDPKHNPTLLVPSPGHQERICNFVKELKYL